MCMNIFGIMYLKMEHQNLYCLQLHHNMLLARFWTKKGDLLSMVGSGNRGNKNS